MNIYAPISVGELIDKITILEIKSLFKQCEFIETELKQLRKIKSTLTQPLIEHEMKLRRINERLWKIEDKLRKKEHLKEFDSEFIELARQVYITNDERASIKKEINEITNSELMEIKIY